MNLIGTLLVSTTANFVNFTFLLNISRSFLSPLPRSHTICPYQHSHGSSVTLQVRVLTFPVQLRVA